jgi:hypothetical protein
VADLPRLGLAPIGRMARCEHALRVVPQAMGRVGQLGLALQAESQLRRKDASTVESGHRVQSRRGTRARVRHLRRNGTSIGLAGYSDIGEAGPIRSRRSDRRSETTGRRGNEGLMLNIRTFFEGEHNGAARAGWDEPDSWAGPGG